jgi:hypothetical protein
MTVSVHHPRRASLLGAAVVLALSTATASSCTSKPSGADHHDASDVWPITECGTFDGTGCAKTSERVDLRRPTFSDPTKIDNPLFPVSKLTSVIQVGRVEGKPFRSETTTLPKTGVVNWYGTKVRVVLSQYVGYLDGQIEEIALDRYAQADDGSVWYFGEDVIDYRDGNAYFTEGTWLTGRDGPPAMIMPAHPKKGDVFRVENVLGVVFEELTVIETHKTIPGPVGKVRGAIVVDELGLDGGHSKKTLAPGYGEFLTAGGGELEAMAVSTPANAIKGGAPVEVRRILTSAGGIVEYARSGDWELADYSVGRIRKQLAIVDRTKQPSRVSTLLHEAVARLDKSVHGRRLIPAQQAAIDVAQSGIDLQARYLDPVDTEVARFHLHTQQLRVDALSKDKGRVAAEVAALEWINDRLAARMSAAERAMVDRGLAQLHVAADSGNLAAAADRAVRLAADVRNATTH